jgi:hypothetical protein
VKTPENASPGAYDLGIRSAARAPALAACAFLLGSSGAPRDPVTECLKGAVAAAEKRDADGVMARVAEGFRDAEGGLDGLLPRSSRWSFDVRLEAGSGGWKIASAAWSLLDDGN